MNSLLKKLSNVRNWHKNVRNWRRVALNLIIVAIVLGISISQAIPVRAVSDRYWVGGNGNWSDTAHWSASDGGAGGESVPTSANDARITSNSDNPAGFEFTITLTGSVACRDLNMSLADTSFLIAANSGYWFDIYNDAVLSSNLNGSYSGLGMRFKGTGGGNIITWDSAFWSGNVIFDGVGGGWTLQDAFDCNGYLQLNNGTLDTNNQSVNAGLIYGGTGVNAIDLGASVITIDGNYSGGSDAWNDTDFDSVNFGTSHIIVDTVYVTDFVSSDRTFYDVSIDATSMESSASEHHIIGENTYHDLTLTNNSSKHGVIILDDSQTVTGTFTATGDAADDRLLIKTQTEGATLSITAATVASTFTDYQDITGLGAGSWDISAGAQNSIDFGGNTNITFTYTHDPNATLYWAEDGGYWYDTYKWATTSGRSSGPIRYHVPKITNPVRFDANSFTMAGQDTFIDSGVQTAQVYAESVEFTGVLNDPILNGPDGLIITGDLTMVADTEMSTYRMPVRVQGTSDSNITSAGQSLGALNIYKDSSAAAVNLLDDYDGGIGQFYFEGGTFNTNNHDFIGGTASRTLTPETTVLNLGSSNLELLGWWVGVDTTGLTLNAGTSTIELTDCNFAFEGGGLTYNNVTCSDNGVLAIRGANTFTGTFTRQATNAFTDGITFAADQTFNGQLYLHGFDITHRLQVGSSSLGTQRQLTANSTLDIVNCDIKDIAGVGSSGWNISAGYNADMGNNLGITFTAPTNIYWVGNTGNWSDINHWSASSGGVGGYRVPLVTDTAKFDPSSTTIPGRIITIDITNLSGIDTSAATYNPTFSKAGTADIYGDMIWGNATWSVTTTDMAGFLPAILSDTGTGGGITTAFHVLKTEATMTTLSLNSNFTVIGTAYVDSGVLDLDAYTLTAAAFNSSTTTYNRAVTGGTGAFLLTGTGVITKWNVNATKLTFTAEDSTIYFSNSGASTQTFAGASLTYNNFVIMGAGNYTTTLTGNNVFGDFYVDRSVAAKTISGAVTCTVDNLYVPASGATLITITNTDWLKATGTVAGSYLSISGSTAAGGASFLAGTAPPSVDGGGNAGWVFASSTAPTVSTATATLPTLIGATLNGELTNLGSFGGSTVYLFFEYGPDPAYGNTTTEQAVTVIGTFNDALTGLSSDTLYYYRAATRYDGASYTYGAQLTFTTSGAPVITTSAATDVGAISASLQGLLDTSLATNVYVRFDYGYDTSYGFTSPWQTFTADTSFNAFVYNLQPSTTYYFRAVGLYGAAVYVYGSSLTLVTTDGSGTDADQSANRDRDVLPEAETSDWFLDPDVGGTLLTNPFRPLVTMLSDNSTLTEKQVWRLYALAIILFFVVLTAKSLPHHLLITGIVAGALIWGCVALTIFPGWALLFAVGGVLGGLVAERTGQL